MFQVLDFRMHAFYKDHVCLGHEDGLICTFTNQIFHEKRTFEDPVPITSDIVVHWFIRSSPLAILAPLMGDSLSQKQSLARTLFPGDVKVPDGIVNHMITTEFVFIRLHVQNEYGSGRFIWQRIPYVTLSRDHLLNQYAVHPVCSEQHRSTYSGNGIKTELLAKIIGSKPRFIICNSPIIFSLINKANHVIAILNFAPTLRAVLPDIMILLAKPSSFHQSLGLPRLKDAFMTWITGQSSFSPHYKCTTHLTGPLACANYHAH